MTSRSRREFLKGGAAFVGGASLAGAATYVATTGGDTPPQTPLWGEDALPFFGEHQAGVETPAQALATFVAFDLRPGADREAVGRLLRLWTDDAARLTSGTPALADTEPELALRPARLTVTFGVTVQAQSGLVVNDTYSVSCTEAPTPVEGLPITTAIVTTIPPKLVYLPLVIRDQQEKPPSPVRWHPW